MQIILKNDVDHLGYAGDVVEVKKGYWRNYLRPRGLAETATAGKVADLTQAMERRRAAQARNADEAKELQALLNRTVLTIPAHAGPQGKLFGSVGANDIAKALDSARKLRVDAKKVVLDEPIKALGTYMVSIEVFTGVKAEVKTIVVESTEELNEAQKTAMVAADAAAVAQVEAAEAAQAAKEAATEAGESEAADTGAEATAADAPDAAATEASAPEAEAAPESEAEAEAETEAAPADDAAADTAGE